MAPKHQKTIKKTLYPASFKMPQIVLLNPHFGSPGEPFMNNITGAVFIKVFNLHVKREREEKMFRIEDE